MRIAQYKKTYNAQSNSAKVMLDNWINELVIVLQIFKLGLLINDTIPSLLKYGDIRPKKIL